MRHIYVHVPFCARRCTYCDFAIAVRKHIPHRAFVDAVLCEYARRRDSPEWDSEPLETLYLGGGTPSLLDPGELLRLVGTLTQHEPDPGERNTDNGVRITAPEITLEANPDDVTPERARAWRAAGVTRVSVGAQSFDPAVLEWMHRTHTADGTAEAVGILRRAGGFSVSLDLIFARPDGMTGSFRRDLDRALALEPDHLSVYGLAVEPKTALAKWVARGAVRPAPEERYAAEFIMAHEVLTAAGFDHYEVSNYARPGHRSRHNAAYWDGRPYGGLGPSAHSFRAPQRWWNLRDWAGYQRAVAAGRDPTASREHLSPDQARLERVYLGLRTLDGVPLALLAPLAPRARLAGSGWVVFAADRLRATPEGWLRLDELVTTLTTFGEGG